MPTIHLSSLAQILWQIAAILVASQLLSRVARWLGQPLVIAEMVAGIALGPSLLGSLWPAGMAAIFPVASLDALALLSQVGLVSFMFLIGLELDLELIRRSPRAVVFISHASIALPFVLGVGAAWSLLASYAPPGVPAVSSLLFLGIAMSVTAFPVLARILRERELTRSRVGTIAIACAAVDDVTAWCLLAVIVALVRQRQLTGALWTIGLTAAFVACMLYVVGPRLTRWASSTVVSGGEALRTSTVLACLALSSSVTELIGIHALFGAFIFGVTVSKERSFAQALARRLETPTVVLLLPLFFAYSGLRTRIGLMEGLREWLIAGGLLFLATLGKFGGGALAARLAGLGWREASAIGVLMNTRGLMELIVLNIGLDLGVISQATFTMMVLVALVTTVATTPVIQWLQLEPDLPPGRANIRQANGGIVKVAQGNVYQRLLQSSAGHRPPRSRSAAE